jgi:hypothetical protein
MKENVYKKSVLTYDLFQVMRSRIIFNAVSGK